MCNPAKGKYDGGKRQGNHVSGKGNYCNKKKRSSLRWCRHDQQVLGKYLLNCLRDTPTFPEAKVQEAGILVWTLG